MKRRYGFPVLSVILCTSMYICMMPKFDAYATTTKEKLEQAEQQHKETQEKIDDTKENIEDLTNVKNSLQGELKQLNEQLTEVSENLEDLEKKIEDKEAEIEQTEADLEEAMRIETEQYEAMKKRIRFIYEKQDFMIMDMIFSSQSMADFINKNDYVESLSAYDRKMLTKYEETRASIEDTKALLEQEKKDLDAYHEEVVAEQEKVQGYVNNTSSSISNYTGQIKDAEAVCEAYETQAAQEEADIQALKKKLAEEIRLSKLAAQSSWRDISEVSFDEGDRYLLANLIYCEAGNQPYAGQLAVGAVVINRVLSSVYPDTVVGVIYQNKQFSPVGSGRLALALAENNATEACYRAADEAMSGQTNVGTCVYFRTPIEGLSGIEIGGHIFY
ncbi:MAG: cell wall hydrolase [Lachnospiraceae bacterium]|nr:cell wall hydrolase [Lachnospiraceae bacterium]